MITNERTLSTLKKYGELLLCNGSKYVVETKDKSHIILYPKDDIILICRLLINGSGVNFATINTDRPQIVMECENNKDLKEILESIEDLK